ncbi:hypothetical protein L2Y96_21195 [Luteibacter aegosomaticola]|uniref:hypothetical protein n=1 Tax=Luteibacter aegosomaticola TaxID=2911538 RepID=UPI001FFA3C3E|nr:hypothetical protein [Luteibacter aegosomaticola]UPG89874.1 hypothetical protein L2Y96_21195 [Luteibacter aegosomaticola]
MSQLRLAVQVVYVPDTPEKPCDPPVAGGGFTEGDELGIGTGRVDPSGRGEYAMSYYRLQLDNPVARRRSEGLNAEDIKPVLNEAGGVTADGYGVRFWRHHEEIFSRDERINGLLWHHYAFTRYDSPSADPSVMGTFKTFKSVDIAEKVNNAPAVFDITEVYVHIIDDDHAIIARGRYDRMVIEDPGWYASRKDVLARMIKSLTVEAVSDAEVERSREASKERRRQRESAK